MGANTKIEWCDVTFNPWRGCSKVAPGCANCYADTQSKRNPRVLGIWGPNGTRVVASEDMWREPMKWNRLAGEARDEWYGVMCSGGFKATVPSEPQRPRVFCASLADVFEDWRGPIVNAQGERLYDDRRGGWSTECSDRDGHRLYLTMDDVRGRLFRLIDATPHLNWLVLTKRPENIRKMWPVMQAMRPIFPGCPGGLGKPVPCVVENACRQNVWIGTSIACQEDAERNIPLLLQCRDLSPVLWLSIEPLIGPVDLEQLQALRPTTIDWVIVGGESGPNARPCNVAWIRSIVRQCQDAGVPVFLKQLGGNVRDYGTTGATTFPLAQCWPNGTAVDEGDPWRIRLRDPKGGDPAEWPNDLRVREFPSV